MDGRLSYIGMFCHQSYRYDQSRHRSTEKRDETIRHIARKPHGKGYGDLTHDQQGEYQLNDTLACLVYPFGPFFG